MKEKLILCIEQLFFELKEKEETIDDSNSPIDDDEFSSPLMITRILLRTLLILKMQVIIQELLLTLQILFFCYKFFF